MPRRQENTKVSQRNDMGVILCFCALVAILSKLLYNRNNTAVKILYTILYIILIGTAALSQTFRIAGKVIDNKTKEPLAFVNITFNDSKLGTTTNIDGKFSFTSPQKINSVKISYLGYATLTLTASEIKTPLVIELTQVTYNINEVTVLPGENPAHRIINKVLTNRDSNNPEKIGSFSYTSYSKMIFTLDLEELTRKDSTTRIMNDSDYIDTRRFLDTMHIMITESVSERKFIYPDKYKEQVTASRISGLKDPSFTLLATQMQSFSFYNDRIMLFDKMYINPVSNGSTRSYFFQIEDTLFTGSNDTVFIISYRPSKGKNFEGLAGQLQINTNKYAIQSVIAEPYDPDPIIGIKIQQKYEYIDNKQWFPVQLNTDLIFNNAQLKIAGKPVRLIGIGKSYLCNILLEPQLDKKEFGSTEIVVDKNANRQDDEFWNTYRSDSLSKKDKNTYHVIDSIGKAENLDLKIKSLESLLAGYIPFKIFNIDIAKLISTNRYEGLRVGLGLMTNKKLARWFSVGGYVGYGFGDKALKYGAELDLFLYKKWELMMKLNYRMDVSESASYRFLEDRNLFVTESNRNYIIEMMDSVESREVAISFRTLQYLRVNFFVDRSEKISTSGYRFCPDAELPATLTGKFGYAEAGVNLKYAFKEKFMESPLGKYSMGTNYPVVWLNIIKGIAMVGGEYNYLKLEAKVFKIFSTKTFGRTHLTLVGGLVKGIVPYTNLYAGRSNYGEFNLDASNSFATMKMNEFISDRFVHVFFKQDFAKLLFRPKFFHPEIAVVNNIGFGNQGNFENHYYVPIRTFEKGFFETGLLVSNIIIQQKLIGYGLGVYYRYGPYTFAETKDNFAFKFTINVVL